MARVHAHRHGPAQQSTQRSSTLDHTKKPRKKPYKVVMEVVTQEKKKLRSVIAYSAESPPGYAFMPLGHPELTEYCKERCRRRNLEAHIVTAKPKKRHLDLQTTSQHAPIIDTQRIGHHFPKQVIADACDIMGYTWLVDGTFVRDPRNFEASQLGQRIHDYAKRMNVDGSSMTEREAEDQIRGAIREVFPKIPTSDLDGVVRHAFQEGTARVGNAKDLTLARRVQLAVGAYIRHQYTDYDAILKSGTPWIVARSQVQEFTHSKLNEWRDEGDTSYELEETFRETIVLDDEEDDSDSDDSSFQGSDASVEIISSQATARELQPTNPADYLPTNERAMSFNRRPLTSLEPVRKPTVAAPFQGYPSHQLAHVSAQVPHARQTPLHYKVSHHEPPTALRQTEAQRAPPPPRSGLVRASDGQLYNLEPIHEPRSRVFSRQITNPIDYQPPMSSMAYDSRNRMVQSPRLIDAGEGSYSRRPAQFASHRRESKDEDVLPSIEPETGTAPSPQRAPSALPTTPANVWPEEVPSPMASQRKRKGFDEASYKDALGLGHPFKRLRPAESKSSTFVRHPYPARDTYIQAKDQHTHAREQPRFHEIIDLTSNPQRRLIRDRRSDVVPLPAYAPSGQNDRPYVSTTTHNNTLRDPHMSRGYEMAHNRVAPAQSLAHSFAPSEGLRSRHGLH